MDRPFSKPETGIIAPIISRIENLRCIDNLCWHNRSADWFDSFFLPCWGYCDSYYVAGIPTWDFNMRLRTLFSAWKRNPYIEKGCTNNVVLVLETFPFGQRPQREQCHVGQEDNFCPLIHLSVYPCIKHRSIHTSGSHEMTRGPQKAYKAWNGLWGSQRGLAGFFRANRMEGHMKIILCVLLFAP